MVPVRFGDEEPGPRGALRWSSGFFVQEKKECIPKGAPVTGGLGLVLGKQPCL